MTNNELSQEDLKELINMITYSTRHNSMYGESLISKLNNMVMIQERLREFKSFGCSPLYPWSARYVYDEMCEILGEPKSSKPLELDAINPQ